MKRFSAFYYFNKKILVTINRNFSGQMAEHGETHRLNKHHRMLKFKYEMELLSINLRNS